MNVMSTRVPSYPDITDILARKAEGRRQLAALSFGEKLEMLDALRERVEPLRRARDGRGKKGEPKKPGMD
jgi:hypothetical protein